MRNMLPVLLVLAFCLCSCKSFDNGIYLRKASFHSDVKPMRVIVNTASIEKCLKNQFSQLPFNTSDYVGVIKNNLTWEAEPGDYYLSVIGFSRAEFEAGLIDWRKLTPSQWLDADHRAIDEVRREGACDPYEKQYLRRDGSLVDVLLAVARVPGQDEHLAAFVLDISDRKRIEREMRKLNEELEARVAQRTSELQAKNEELARLNRVFVDRELRMRELKEKIAQLERDHPQ